MDETPKTPYEKVKDELRQRVKNRLIPGEVIPGESYAIDEFTRTIYDRMLILVDCDELPSVGLSIVADATMKALRLRGYEGSKSETDSDGGSISNSFIDDVLEANKSDILALKSRARGQGTMGVQFL